MKHLFLLATFFAFTSVISAQNLDRDTYTVSGGLLGALNYNKFRIDGDNAANISFQPKLGWSVGAWMNLPFGQVVSLEPQVMYSLYNYTSVSSLSTLLPRGNISYISVPILLKFDLDNWIAFTFGPQIDFLAELSEVREDVLKEHFASTSFGLSAGLELLPHEHVTLFGRFIYGMSDLDDRDLLDDDEEYYNNNFQVGVKVRLFGDVIPADTDNDGIIDADDLCPTVPGIAAFNGCPDTDNDGITDALDDCPLVAGIARYNGCPIPDTDNDGVNDEVDKCPTVAGVAKYDGCPIPDTDGDGINDDEDNCPTVAGLAKYNGCPIPDTDGDGVNDEMDECPTVFGLAQFKGCPNPDRDGDGVPDAIDLCPNIKGPASNDGCPVVESAVFNTRMINFVSGKSDLTAQAKRDLKAGAALINSGDFANLKIEIQGHTDSVGSDESNHSLSHRRADAVKAELIKNGVREDRLTTIGHGETKPIADNDTAAGRALNRRVEMKPRE